MLVISQNAFWQRVRYNIQLQDDYLDGLEQLWGRQDSFPKDKGEPSKS